MGLYIIHTLLCIKQTEKLIKTSYYIIIYEWKVSNFSFFYPIKQSLRYYYIIICNIVSVYIINYFYEDEIILCCIM